MASYSSCLEFDIEKLRRGFAMLKTLGEDSEGKCLNAGNRLITILSVAEDTTQSGYFCDPASVVVTFEFDGECHDLNVASGEAV